MFDIPSNILLQYTILVLLKWKLQLLVFLEVGGYQCCYNRLWLHNKMSQIFAFWWNNSCWGNQLANIKYLFSLRLFKLQMRFLLLVPISFYLLYLTISAFPLTYTHTHTHTRTHARTHAHTHNTLTHINTHIQQKRLKK